MNDDKKEILFSKAMLPPLDDFYNQLRDIWKTGWLATFGPKHEIFETMLKERLNSENLLVFVNGHTALESAIGCIGKSGEIITTPYTFISTANAIYRNGFKPVFCDVNHNMTLDVKSAENLITDKTVAIVATHVLGNPCEVEHLEKIGKKHNLKIIYDGAHVFGVKYKGRCISEYGDATMYSFHASKVFNSAEGGAVVFNDKEIGNALQKFRYFGMEKGQTTIPGLNGKMNEITAALGICNLNILDNIIAVRKKLYNRYVTNLRETAGIYLRVPDEDIEYNYIYFYIQVDEKEYGMSATELLEVLQDKGIHAKKSFPMLISDMELYKDCTRGNLDNSRRFLKEIIVLPLHPELQEIDVDYICTLINDR